MRTILLVLCFLFSELSVASVECDSAYQSFQKRFSSLEKKYETLSETKVLDSNKPTWTWGRKKQAVYLLHGFIGTPEEMAAFGQILNAEGYTVINDIIPGYGADGIVANQFDSNSWVRHVEANLKQIRGCFHKIHLIGFSTGGLLLHNYVRKHREDFTAESLTLFSPFYKPHWNFSDLLRTATRLVTPIVLTKPLYFVTRFPDIKIAVLKTENYLQQLPLDGAKYVFDFGLKVDSEIDKDPMGENETATLLFVSESDQIMDLETTIKNLSADFKNLNLVKYHNQYVPHHLMLPEVSRVAKQVLETTVQFIKTR